MEGFVYKSAKGNLYFGKDEQSAVRLLATESELKSNPNFRDYIQSRDTEYGTVLVIVAPLEKLDY